VVGFVAVAIGAASVGLVAVLASFVSITVTVGFTIATIGSIVIGMEFAVVIITGVITATGLIMAVGLAATAGLAAATAGLAAATAGFAMVAGLLDVTSEKLAIATFDPITEFVAVGFATVGFATAGLPEATTDLAADFSVGFANIAVLTCTGFTVLSKQIGTESGVDKLNPHTLHRLFVLTCNAPSERPAVDPVTSTRGIGEPLILPRDCISPSAICIR
jgi:hypothetical protein